MATEILMSALSPTMAEGTLAKWLVKEGNEVSSGSIIAEIETDQAAMECEAVDEGEIGKILISEGFEAVKVKAAPAGGYDAAAPTAPKTSDGTRIFASPLARRIAAEKGLDLATINGSGPRGRIVKADVEALDATGAPAQHTPAPAKPDTDRPETASAPAAFSAQGPSSDQIAAMYLGRDFEEVTLSGMRKTTAARLTEAKQQIPHYYLRRDIAHHKSLSALSAEMKHLATRARNRKLAPHEYQGGGFAISNLGMFVIDNFDAVINPPHGAIFAVDAGGQEAGGD